MEIMQSMVIGSGDAQPGKIAAEASNLIPRIIGVNALTEQEIRKVLAIVRAAYEPGPFLAKEEVKPGMILLLQQVAAMAASAGLKDEIAGTIDFVRVQ